MRLRQHARTFDPSGWQRYIPVLVVLAAVAVYINTFWNGFAYDDVFIIQNNTRVHNLAAWRDIWFKPYWPFHGSELGIYRPFAIHLYAVEWAVGGGKPWLFHVVNTLLHAAATLLAFLLLKRLTAPVPAMIGALIFAVHPIHTEAVANIVGQAELVTATALLGCCLIHVSRPDGVHVSWPRRLALVVLFAIALTTKESSVVLPGLLVALDFAQRRVRVRARELAHYTSALLMPLILLGAVLVLYLAVRFDALGGTLIGSNANPSLPYLREPHRVLNALRAFPEFVRLLFFPLELSADYAPGVVLAVDSLTMMTLLGALLLAGLTALALLTPWWPGAGLPAAWFLISMIVVSNLFFPIGVLIAERTLYLPSFAVSLLVANLWLAAAPQASRVVRKLAPVAVVIAVLLLGARTWLRNPSWANTASVFKTLATEHPESYRAQWAQASALWVQSELEQAGLRFAFAERMYPRDAEMLAEYGIFLMNQGNRKKALDLLERAYQMRPDAIRTNFMLAYTLALDGQYPESLKHITAAEDLGLPRYASMPLRAHVYHGLGDHDRAVGAWRVAVSHAAGNPYLWGFLARTIAIAGRQTDAVSTLERALTITVDSTASQKLNQLRAAIQDGCYSGLADLSARVDAANGMPACDPIGDYYKYIVRHAEIASTLQNASIPVVVRGDSVPPKNVQVVDAQ